MLAGPLSTKGGFERYLCKDECCVEEMGKVALGLTVVTKKRAQHLVPSGVLQNDSIPSDLPFNLPETENHRRAFHETACPSTHDLVRASHCLRRGFSGAVSKLA
jgi:hypothetical protein